MIELMPVGTHLYLIKRGLPPFYFVVFLCASWDIFLFSEGEVFYSECFHECQSIHRTSILIGFRGRKEP